MDQFALDTMHNSIPYFIQQWASGLITDEEFTTAMAGFAETYRKNRPAMLGLIDPATGLSYTPKGAGTGLQFNTEKVVYRMIRA